MTTTFRTHLTGPAKWAEKSPTAPAFKVPQWSEAGEFGGWKPVSYAQYWGDIEKYARYVYNEFTRQGLKERDTVGIWTSGANYVDIVHIWAVARAGFVPLLISIRIQHLGALDLLLKGGEAKGLLYNTAVAKPELDVVSIPAVDIKTLDAAVGEKSLPEVWFPSNEDEIVMKYHSSGSSSGMPKVIPMTARWVDFLLDKLVDALGSDPNKQENTSANGSAVHLAGAMTIIASHYQGQCIVICKEISSSREELKALIEDHGLTRIVLFSTFLAKFIIQARSDPELLKLLKSLNRIIHGGVPLDEKYAKEARDQGIKLRDIFGSTEIGVAMISGDEGPNEAYLRPIAGTKYKFVPVNDASTESQNDASAPKLLEVIITAESGDCPHPSYRNKETGDFHTGDLVEEVAPGYYLSRGRNDDWMKMQNAALCDTQSIEGNALEVAGKDLIGAAVCIGLKRPSPVLVVEPLHDGDVPSTLTLDVFERIKPFHERMYAHERIDDAKFIIVAPKGSLPKTPKGNVQRKPVEKTFEKQLDELFGQTNP
ncbi:hypothetical protein V2G26_002004 [Clonostachys chloroleuca]